MGTYIKHSVPDRVKQSFVIFDVRALRRSDLGIRVPGCQKLRMTGFKVTVLLKGEYHNMVHFMLSNCR